ncbi:RNAse PH [Desulfonispora thiosulfatigenes DSM 11270]|uniref:Ribonuclease PH n=1 Tax=Desulfonispora thiosulfatigenes DSM 11270 TaxID=656914 RepID=A0A1W1V802_DESTI|nr:ribonuclease PH [Desulfonispora thiosulfatigenes]SMB89393.1 RNAse PH [Desulfonispora thiosulfatigenes DSM 11270]
MRDDGRNENELRKVRVEQDYIKYPEGSILFEMGDTKVICNATVEEKIPGWLKGQEKGWITAEYSMLPRATDVRTRREATQGKIGGRTQEIQRLIGRSLRPVVDLKALGERTIWIDCDVIQADGGTRTAAITGGFIALVKALQSLVEKGILKNFPILDYVAAVSIGKVGENILLDLAYSEDCEADVDLNLVMTGSGKFIEIQGTAEGYPFNREELDEILMLGEEGINKLIEIQKSILGSIV